MSTDLYPVRPEASYSIPEVARILRTTPADVRRMIRQGFLDAYRLDPTNPRSQRRVPGFEILNYTETMRRAREAIQRIDYDALERQILAYVSE